MKVRPLVALDIGSTKVACAIGLPHEQAPGFELLGSSLIPYPSRSETWLGDPLMVSRTIEQALEATAVSGEFDRAFVSINHPRLSSERAQVGVTLADQPIAVRAKDLQRLQTSALHQVLGVDREPLLIERLSCSGNGFDGVRDPRGLTATRVLGTFHVLTMPIAARQAIVQAVESAGLEVVRLTYSLPAALASVADEEWLRQRVLLIDAGGLTTDVGLFVEGVLHGSRVLPQGGLTLTSAIAKELRVTVDQALTWSLEGRACRKPEVRAMIERHWELLREAIEALMKDRPRPDATLLTGRAALIDGFAEWVEQAAGTPTALCRSARTSRLGELSRQVALSPAIGLLELSTRHANGAAVRSPHLFNRWVDHTRAILTEYF